MINIQPPEKRQTMFSNGHEKLDVHSIFYTIQGEGPFCGTPAVFVRLAGCNLQCPSCDTNYTTGRTWMDTDEICRRVRVASMQMYDSSEELSRISNSPTDTQAISIMPARLVVITGGEPFRQQIDLLVLKLIQRYGYFVQVETNGVLPPPRISHINTNIDERRGFYIVCSPKAGKVNPKTAEAACCFKYVMGAHSVDPVDGLPIHVLDHSLGVLRVARPPADFKRPVYLQPQDDQSPSRNEANLRACIHSCMKHGYILQLQVHKILNME